MSDYFTSLATRAVQDGSGMRPRPRTPFEPIAAAPAEGPPAVVEDTADAGAAVQGDTRAQERLERERRAAPRRGALDAGETAAGRREVAPVSVGARREPDRAAPGHDGHDVLAAPRPARLVTTPIEGDTLPLPAAIEPAASRQPARVDVRAAARRPQAHQPPPTTPAGRVDAPTWDDGTEPTIRIHIGRVDVRAAASTPGRTAPRPAGGPPDTPLMTLEEYARLRRESRS